MADQIIRTLTPEAEAEIRQMARDIQDLKRGQTPTQVVRRQVSEDSYFCIPYKGTQIPPRVGDTPGSELCCIYKIDDNDQLSPITFPDGSHYMERVYNIYDTPAGEEYHVCHRSKHGAFFVMDPRLGANEGQLPPAPTQCQGYCVWVWAAATSEWVLDTDACSPAPTTTGTPQPCLCPTTTTTAAPTSTTTEPGPTTTTPAPCQCDRPPQCGTADGEVAVTGCTGGAPHPDGCEPCPCDCAAHLSTTPPGCGTGCQWVLVVVGAGLAWRWVSGDCQPSGPVLNGVPAPPPSPCRCHPPTGTGFACGDWVVTGCHPLPPVGPCRGLCHWYWIPDGVGGGAWYLTTSNCNRDGGVSNCYCEPPSQAPADPYDVCTTSENPCRSTDPVDPCWCCDGTTTTTPAPCDDWCRWVWVGDWVKVEDPCLGTCPCGKPVQPGLVWQEVTYSPCGTGDPPLPTTAPPPPPPVGRCCFPDNPTCYIRTEANCAGGTWAEGGNCNGFPPCPGWPAPTTTTLAPGVCPPGQEDWVGCCVAAGGCTVTTCAACATAGGTWYNQPTCAGLPCVSTTTTTAPTTTEEPSGPSGPSGTPAP
jgi:hypothetical protein